MKKQVKNKSGITLIALVVTIVVLLILAGVTIALVLGNNGIIKRAQEAKEQTAQSQNKEMEDLNNLENYMNGKIEGIVSVDDIVKTPATYYGKEVTGYTCINSAACKWKILYAGNEFSTDGKNHIYLIADDYVARNYLPNSSKGNALNAGDSSYPKAAYFSNILNDYTGSGSITDARIKKLNNSYFSKYSSTNNNMKSVAYMLDINAWNVYKGAKADYAVGGPSVEMLMKSYSQKHNVNYQARASSAIGYEISKDGGANWATYYSGMLSTSDKLYINDTGTTNAYGYWLASPSAGNSDCVMYVDCYGSVGWDGYSGGRIGFRPLVCLSSDVKLQDSGNGTFAIK